MTSADLVLPRAETPETPIAELVVVIPANDEEALLGGCLAAVASAVAALRRRQPGPPVAVRVVVVLDDCADGSAAVVGRRPEFEAHPVEFRNVGLTRAHGVRVAIEGSSVDPSQLWIANTDADSVVPSGWLVTQLAHARAGVELLVGSVRPDPADLTAAQYRAWRARDRHDSAMHVHGANLGVRADQYLAAGGFPPDPEHEDVLLVERLLLRGARLVSTREGRVRTSARTAGRTPGGYSEWVRENY